MSEAGRIEARVSLAPLKNRDELRRIIRARRAEQAAASGSGCEAVRGGANRALPSAETLQQQLEPYRDTFDFDLTSRVPLFGPPLTLLKRLIRRLLRSYIDRQAAFNQNCLALFLSANDEQSRREQVAHARMEQLEKRVAELEHISGLLLIELRTRGEEAAAIVLERATSTNTSR